MVESDLAMRHQHQYSLMVVCGLHLIQAPWGTCKVAAHCGWFRILPDSGLGNNCGVDPLPLFLQVNTN